MTTPRRTRFVINLPGLNAELEGDRKFVEDLYHKIVKDVGPIIAATADRRAKASTPRKDDTDEREGPRGGYTWVYLVTELFNKVYVVDNTAVENTVLGRFLDADRVRRIYLNAEKTAQLTGLTSGSRTLWAEFTDAGRAMLRRNSDTHVARKGP